MSRNSPILELSKGDNDTLVLSVAYSDGSVVNITDAEIKFTVKRNDFDSLLEAILQKTTASDTEIKITNGINGEAEIYLKPTDSSSIDARKYVFDVQVKLNDGTTHTVLKDWIKFIQDIS